MKSSCLMLCAATLVISCSISGSVAAQDPAKPAPDPLKANNYADANEHSNADAWTDTKN